MNKLDELLKEFFRRESLEQDLKQLYFGGFDTYEDYIKYGDMFIHIPPISRCRDLTIKEK